ncbi:PAS domain S-box protein, partial [archaeon]
IAAQHDHFLRVHLETGENHVIGNMGRHLMAKHADGHLFPVALTVEEESVGGYNTYHGSLRAVAEIEGVVYINLQGRVLHASQGLCYLLGYRQSQIEGRNINIIMPEPYKSKHNTYLRRYRETGRTRFINTRQIVPVMHSDGSTFAAQLEVASVKVPEYGACLAARIIAAAVTAEEALKQARQAVATAKQRDADIAAAEEAAVRAAAEAVEAAERAKTEAEEKERREAAEAAEAEKQRIEEAQLAEERRAPRSHRHRRHGRRRHARGRGEDDTTPMSNDSRHQDAVNLTRTPSDASYASHDSRSSDSSSDSSSYVGSRATGDTGSSSRTPSTHSRSPASSVVDSYVSSSCASSVVDSSRTGQPRDRRRRRRGQAESDKGSVTHDLPAAIGLQSGRTRSSRSARRTPSGRQLREPEDRRSPETNLAHAKSEAAVASETLVPVAGTSDEEPAASRFGISVDGTRVKAGSVSTPAVAVQSTPTADAAFGRAKASDQAPLLRVSHEHAAAARPRV